MMRQNSLVLFQGLYAVQHSTTERRSINPYNRLSLSRQPTHIASRWNSAQGVETLYKQGIYSSGRGFILSCRYSKLN